MNSYLNAYREMISLRGLTRHTMKSYCTYIHAYLDFLQNVLHKSPEDVSWDDLRAFILWLQISRRLSDRTINAVISQLRFFTIYVLHKPWDPYQLPFRRFDTRLPFVPSHEDTLKFLASVENPKAAAILSLMYSSGLRAGEACALRYEDVSRKDMRIHITKAKNRSDRYVPLSSRALDILTEYWRKNGRPMGWLFPQQTNNQKHIYPQFLDIHIRKTEGRLGWPHKFACHTLRHAYATHLYEQGADLLSIKHLLGHKSLNSTVIYVSLARVNPGAVISPFDKGGFPLG